MTTNPTDWITKPSCCDVCVYTTCDSANDYNTISAHVGSANRVDCTTIYVARLCGLCGGICYVNGKGKDLKVLYEQKYNLTHQDPDCCTSYCAPEAYFKQIMKEHQSRFNVPLTAAAPEKNETMERK